MKTLNDTVDSMLSNDWKERLVAEIEQLDIRIYDLEKHMKQIGEDSPEYSLLEAQREHMQLYLTDLTARAYTFNIKYELPSIDERMKDIRSNESISNSNTIWIAFLLGMLFTGGNNKWQ